MSDEAFARRFYSDRAELTALGVPLHSQRDEFTGEELYTLRSENYFLDRARARRRRARGAPDRALHARGQVRVRGAAAARAPEPRARPARASVDAPTETAERVRVTAPDYSPELAGAALEARGRDLEAAHDQVPLLVACTRAGDGADAQPVRAPARRGRLVRRRPRPRPRRDPHVPRLADPLATSGSRRAASATSACPPTSTSRRTASRGPGRSGRRPGSARIEVQGDTAWWVHRTLADAGTVEDGVFETPYSTLGPLVVVGPPPERPGRAARAGRASRRGARRAAPAPRTPHGSRARDRARAPRRVRGPPTERQPAGPVAPERFGVLQALLAHLLAAVRRRPQRRPRRRRARRAVLAPARGAPGAPSRSSTSSTSAAAATRSTPRSTTTQTACTSTRSCTATSSAGRRS